MSGICTNNILGLWKKWKGRHEEFFNLLWKIVFINVHFLFELIKWRASIFPKSRYYYRKNALIRLYTFNEKQYVCFKELYAGLHLFETIFFFNCQKFESISVIKRQRGLNVKSDLQNKNNIMHFRIYVSNYSF